MRGGGGAEHARAEERLERWMDFVEDPRYSQLRRASVLKPLGVEARAGPRTDQLLMYFPWPGFIHVQMPVGDVWGTGQEERILRYNQEL